MNIIIFRYINLILMLLIVGFPTSFTLVHVESRFIDLTHSFEESTIYWPTSCTFKLDEVHKGKTKSGFWYEANNFSAAEHGGIHIDAPVYFAKGRWEVDEIPLNRLIGPRVLVDASHKTKGNLNYLF